MTVPTTGNRVSYACDGVTTVFAFTFKAYSKNDLKVILLSPTGTETALTLDVDYSVLISTPGPGGTVTLIGSYGSTPPASGYTLTIYRELAMTQLIDLVHGDAMPADTLEEGYDRAVMLIQQLSERIGRSILLPVSSNMTGLTLPMPEASKFLRWNNSEDGLENATITDSSVQVINAFWQVVLAAAGTTLDEALNAMGLPVSDYIKTLLDDADADTARATLQIPAASESVAGLAEIATQDEVDAGTDDSRIITPEKLLATPMIFRKNVIINGDMRIAQRGTSFIAAPTNTYPVDRFRCEYEADSVQTLSQEVDAPSGQGFYYSLKWAVTTADTSIDSYQGARIRYNVEGYDFLPFIGKEAVLSFWVKAHKTGTYCVAFRNAGSDRSYIMEYTVNQSDTWEKKTLPITFNYVGGTWNYTNGVGLSISFSLAAGTMSQGTKDRVFRVCCA